MIQPPVPVRLRRALTSSVLALAALSPVAAADTFFVDANLTTGLDDGSSWDDAFQGTAGLQTALAAAVSGDEIWVADGRYLPSDTGVRSASFALKNGVTIYGSFAGGESSPAERPAFGTSDSVLDGDLSGNDGSSAFGDNSFHLITTGGTNATAVIDGFVVRAGNANSGGNNNRGAGILCIGAVSPTVRNCRFLENRCTFGGASGYVNNNGAPTFLDCTFEDGIGGSFGGAFDIAGARATFERCLFRGNTASRAGALECFASTGTEVISCVFYDNTATGNDGGGAIWIGSGGSARVRNTTIVANNATAQAQGGIRNAGVANFRVDNSILYGNFGAVGPGMGPGNQTNATTVVNHSLVQGGFASGTGNVAGDPGFVDLVGGDFTPTLTAVIDAGNNAEVLGATDYVGNPRLVDDPSVADTGAGVAPIVDMGAVEVDPVVPVWVDLGNALAGTSGEPSLVLTGPLTPLSANNASLTNAAPSALTYVIAGFTAVNAPLQGGVLVPAPDFLRLFFTTPGGTLDLPFTWPDGLGSGFESYYQFWTTDAGAVAGFSASNGVRGTTP